MKDNLKASVSFYMRSDHKRNTIKAEQLINFRKIYFLDALGQKEEHKVKKEGKLQCLQMPFLSAVLFSSLNSINELLFFLCNPLVVPWAAGYESCVTITAMMIKTTKTKIQTVVQKIECIC